MLCPKRRQNYKVGFKIDTFLRKHWPLSVGNREATLEALCIPLYILLYLQVHLFVPLKQTCTLWWNPESPELWCTLTSCSVTPPTDFPFWQNTNEKRKKEEKHTKKNNDGAFLALYPWWSGPGLVGASVAPTTLESHQNRPKLRLN